jgi:hypothetical protein
VLDVAATRAPTHDEADLGVFVDRLAAGGSDRGTGLAHAQVRSAIAAGAAPPGLSRLAEALAASVTELPPPRRPADDPGPLVEAMRATSLAVLDSEDPAAVAAAVAAMAADGHRVVVTAEDPAALSAVRDALPVDAAQRSLDRIPAMSPAELRELRRLLAGRTAARRARADQEIPPPAAVPAVDAVAELCALITRVRTTPQAEGTEAVPGVLDGLDADRRTAVVAVAGAVGRTVAALPPRDRHPWAWRLLSELVHNTRGTADDLLVDATAAIEELDRARPGPEIALTGRLPENATDLLCRYLEFLDGGGRARAYFRSVVQREVEPVLTRVAVDGHRPGTADEVRRVIAYVGTAARLRRVEELCTGLGLPAPRTEVELTALVAELGAVVEAARAVGALRHDVLFLAAQSPVPVPDLDSALRVAAAMLAVDERGSVLEAGRKLDRMADDLARSTPVLAMAPEHVRAVAALRNRDAGEYADVVSGLAAVRREIRDEVRCRALLRTLADAAPRLAAAWAGPDDAPGRLAGPFGLVAFVTAERLLAALPPPDSADVVVVHRAGGMGVERLLLAAVAPRLLAVGPAVGRAEAGSELLDVLRRAAAPVVSPGPRRAG